MRLLDLAAARPDRPACQPQPGAAACVDGDHRVHEHAVHVAFLDLAKPAALPRLGRELHLRRILDGQDVPARHRTHGAIGPACDQLIRRHLRVRQEAAELLLALAAAAQPPHADRLARNHVREERCPPLSRRRSPNRPNDNSIAVLPESVDNRSLTNHRRLPCATSDVPSDSICRTYPRPKMSASHSAVRARGKGYTRSTRRTELPALTTRTASPVSASEPSA